MLLPLLLQVNRYGTGLKAMCGDNSGLIAGEEPDIISDRSPFGAFHAPPSPRVSSTSGMGAPAALCCAAVSYVSCVCFLCVMEGVVPLHVGKVPVCLPHAAD